MCHNIMVIFLFSVFIMSQASTITATTTTLSVIIACCGTLPFITTVTMAPALMGLQVTLSQHDVVLLLLLILRDTRGVVSLTTVPQ